MNSQIRKHNISLESAHSAIRALKDTCRLTALMLGHLGKPIGMENTKNMENKEMLEHLTAL